MYIIENAFAATLIPYDGLPVAHINDVFLFHEPNNKAMWNVVAQDRGFVEEAIAYLRLYEAAITVVDDVAARELLSVSLDANDTPLHDGVSAWDQIQATLYILQQALK